MLKLLSMIDIGIDLEDVLDEESPLSQFISTHELDCINDFTIDLKDSLSIFHWNIRSIKADNHFTELQILMSQIKDQPDVFVITESWIESDEQATYYKIPGYSLECYCREGRGGGVMVYINETCSYKKGNFIVEECEQSWIEIIDKRNRNIIIGALYRPPSCDQEKFRASLKEVVSNISLSKKHCVLTGDFNILLTLC